MLVMNKEGDIFDERRKSDRRSREKKVKEERRKSNRRKKDINEVKKKK